MGIVEMMKQNEKADNLKWDQGIVNLCFYYIYSYYKIINQKTNQCYSIVWNKYWLIWSVWSSLSNLM